MLQVVLIRFDSTSTWYRNSGNSLSFGSFNIRPTNAVSRDARPVDLALEVGHVDSSCTALPLERVGW